MSTEQPAAPAWFELAAVLAASLVATVGLAGLALALLGWYRTPLALVLGVPLALAGVVAVRRALGGRAPAGRVAHAGAATAAVLALGFLVLASSAPSHHVLVNRDPGSYATTARWLARDGSLQVDGAAGGLEAEEPLTFESFAVYDVGDGRLQLQFNHLASVVMAVGHDLGGTRLMFRVPALVATAGLMSLYAVAVRMTGRPLASLLAPAALAATMPFLYVARDTFSEPFTMALLWSAVLAGSVAAATRRAGAGAVAGLLLGAAAATRADALLFVAIGLVLGGWWVAGARGGEEAGPRRRVALCALAATAVGVLLGTLDLQLRSGGYAGRHSEQVGVLRVLVLAALVAAIASVVAARVRPGWWPRARALGTSMATPAGVLVAAALLAGWLVRPHVQVMRGRDEVSLIAALQSAAGVEPDPARRYGELSLEWMSWYLGVPGLLLAIWGTAWLVRRALSGRANPATAACVALVVVAGGIYWWRPSISPDHVWAMRRYVPAVLPALVLAATAAVAAVLVAPRWPRGLRSGLAAVLGALLVVVPASVTWPVRQLREQHGSAAVLEEACDLVGRNASVVVVGEPARHILPQSLRAWCGVPVAAATRVPSPAEQRRLAESVGRAGRELVWVATSPGELEGLGPAGQPVATTGVAVEERHPERTLLRAPEGYEPPGDGWSLAVRRTAG